jgi:hypothetical protein
MKKIVVITDKAMPFLTGGGADEVTGVVLGAMGMWDLASVGFGVKGNKEYAHRDHERVLPLLWRIFSSTGTVTRSAAASG